MKITIYELLGLVKDGKAPEKIKYRNKIYFRSWCDYMGDEPIDNYYVDDDGDNWNVDGFLKLDTKIEILEEVEDKEYEDIEEFKEYKLINTRDILELEMIINKINADYNYKINALIRNQKYILERMKRDE